MRTIESRWLLSVGSFEGDERTIMIRCPHRRCQVRAGQVSTQGRSDQINAEKWAIGRAERFVRGPKEWKGGEREETKSMVARNGAP